MSFQLICMAIVLAFLQPAMGSRLQRQSLHPSLRHSQYSLTHTWDTFHQVFPHQEYAFANNATTTFDAWRSAVSHVQILHRPHDNISQSGLPLNLTFRVAKFTLPLPLSPLRTLFSSRQLNHQEHISLNKAIEGLQLYAIVMLLAVWITLEAAKFFGSPNLDDKSRKNEQGHSHTRSRSWMTFKMR